MEAVMSEPTERFDPVERMIKIQGGAAYLQIKDRLIWARQEHPELCVATEMLRLDDKIAVFKARVEYLDSGGESVWGEGHGSETPQGFPAGHIEKAETIAIGRALAAIGYGTAAAFEETADGKIADAPVQRANAPRTYEKPPVRAKTVVNGGPVGKRANGTEDDPPVTPANAGQVVAIERLWKEVGREEADLTTFLFAMFAQEAPAALTMKEAMEVIASLSKEREALRSPARAG
jgi:hypothetical protein